MPNLRTSLIGFIVIAVVIGFGSGVASGYVGLNPQVEGLLLDLKVADERIALLEQNVTSQKKALETEKLQHTLRILELNTLLSERRGIRQSELSRPPVYYDTRVVEIGGIQCTGSMEPVMGCEDVTIGYRPDVRDIRVRDVIVFRELTRDCSGYTGVEIIHRVVAITNIDNARYFKTKGDASPIADPCLISFNNVLLKIIAVVYDAQP